MLFRSSLSLSFVIIGFTAIRTENERHTATYLASITEILEERYLKHQRENRRAKRKRGYHQEDEDEDEEDDQDTCADLQRWRLREDNVSLSQFNKRASKSGNLTVGDVFAKQLMQFYGCTPDKALAIIRNYPTPMTLSMAYDDLDRDEKKKEKLLASLDVLPLEPDEIDPSPPPPSSKSVTPFSFSEDEDGESNDKNNTKNTTSRGGGGSKRKIGLALSKKVYTFYNEFML